jgi:peroxiredoxin (alkyl hydroperoxide reductase subunit C)
MKKYMLVFALAVFGMGQLLAQSTEVPQIGSQAPSFTALSTEGEINFPSDYGKSWKLIFSHPKDFTPVCSSEILELAQAQDVFAEMDAELFVLSTDLLDQHRSWKASLEEVHYMDREPVKIAFPLIADNDLAISKKYGMIHNAASIKENIRGVYFINPDNEIRAIYFYPNEVGRNVDEIQRTLEALQTTYNNSAVVTPANWEPGDDLIVPVLSQEQKESLGMPGSDLYRLNWYMTFKKSE